MKIEDATSNLFTPCKDGMIVNITRHYGLEPMTEFGVKEKKQENQKPEMIL